VNELRAVRRYYASPTLARFHLDDSFYRCVVGPIGSGKSSGGAVEVVRRICQQARKPHGDRWRYSRCAIVRNTYREIEDTVRPTFNHWFPSLGKWRSSENALQIRAGGVHSDILFRALDTADDVRKLLSLELTFAWGNEAKELPRAVVDMLGGRLRYPAREDGGMTWSGVWLDTNAPDELHWIYKQFEEERPAGYRVFHQPSARSAGAENLEHLPPRYYERLSAGKSDAWLKVYVDGQYGFTTDQDKAVFPEYHDALHTQEFPDPPGGDIYVGIDFGLTPAATFAWQMPGLGQWRIHSELTTEDMGAAKFATELKRHAARTYPADRFVLHYTGDPAGDQRSATNEEHTPFRILQDAGINATPAWTQDANIRRDAVGLLLKTLCLGGNPALIVHPRCRILRRGLMGGYRHVRLKVGGSEERWQDKPIKDKFSHVCEALEYGMLGAGEGNNVVSAGGPVWQSRRGGDQPTGRRGVGNRERGLG
jgi:hypothetical protein